MEGVAKAKWSSGSGRSRRTYSEKDHFLNSVTYLLGTWNGESIPIAFGVHKYNFSCFIPPNVPYTMEGKHGHVRFRIDANLDIPWHSDLHADAAFTVMRRDDLNLFPLLKYPVSVEEVQIFCSFLCNLNPFIMTLRMSKQGYAVGETIPIQVSLNNGSTVAILRTVLSLQRTFLYCAEGHTKKECEVIVGQSCRGVDAGQQVTFNELFIIPSSAYTSTDKYCKVFKIFYGIELIVFTDLCSSDQILYAPITIGTFGIQTERPVQLPTPIQRAIEIDVPIAPSVPATNSHNIDLRKITNTFFIIFYYLKYSTAPSYNEVVSDD